MAESSKWVSVSEMKAGTNRGSGWKLIGSPPSWRAEFEQLVLSARRELRIVVPFYSEETVRWILSHARNGVAKYFLLSLSKEGARARTQSTAAIRRIKCDSSSKSKFLENLHAKVVIADEKKAVVTSSNLTAAGLDKNVEMGVSTSDPAAVAQLIDRFNELWRSPQAESISARELRMYEEMSSRMPEHRPSGGFGGVFRVGKVLPQPPDPGMAGPGWILVHSLAEYPVAEEYFPWDELREEFARRHIVPWYWNRWRPMKANDGPYVVLLAYQGKIFGRAEAAITRDIKNTPKYNFAFRLTKYKRERDVDLFQVLRLAHRSYRHRDMIKLDRRVLSIYYRLANRARQTDGS